MLLARTDANRTVIDHSNHNDSGVDDGLSHRDPPTQGANKEVCTMPDTTSSTTEEPTSSEGKGGKGRLIITVVLCLGLAAAGFVLGGKLSGGDGAAAAAADEEPVEEPEPVVAKIVELEPVNVNLADGHYLRIAIALGLSEHALHAEEGGGGHGGGDEFVFETAPASDLVLGTFSGRLMADLESHEGREAARHDLFEGLENFYGEDIVTVFLTEFVMQ